MNKFFICAMMVVFSNLSGSSLAVLPLDMSPPVKSVATYRLSVSRDGIYKVTGERLENLGIELREIDPATIAISNRGNPIPIFVRGEADGKFDRHDAIIFYGKRNYGKNTYYDRFTDENIYWLSWGESIGHRMTTQIVPSGLLEFRTARSFIRRLHFEENNNFTRLPRANFADEVDSIYVRGGVFQRIGSVLTLPPMPPESWFWAGISAPNMRKFQFPLTGVLETTKFVTFRIKLHGSTYNSANPDHHVQLWLNDMLVVSDTYWDGQNEILIENDEISQFYLKEGINKLTVIAPGDTGAGTVDQVLLDWFEVDYWHNFTADNELLWFSAPETSIGNRSGFNVELKNFKNPKVEIFGLDGTRYIGFQPQIADDNQSDNGETPETYKIIFQISDQLLDNSSDRSPDYVALTSEHYLEPDSIILASKSELKNPNNRADYLIIIHENLISGIDELADWRSSRGLRVKVVETQEIYDQFNDGIFSPYAIKDFLSYAYHNWQWPAPAYVLLVGDASLDRERRKNLVPTIHVQTPKYGAAASDNQFVLIDGDDNIPDMAIGRLPVSNLIELEIISDRIIEYEKSPMAGEWQESLLFLTGVGKQFAQQNQELSTKYVSSELQVKHLQSTQISEPIYGASRATISAFNRGAAMVNFLGHGGGSIWSDNRMMNLQDVELLQNDRKLPFVLSMTCFTGYFDNPHRSSLGEEMLLAKNGGAIAFLGATGFGWTLGDFYFDQEIFTQIFRDNVRVVGDIVKLAKKHFLYKYPGYVDLSEMFTLLGDPALELVIPKMSPIEEKSDQRADLVVLANEIFWKFSPTNSNAQLSATIKNIGTSTANDVHVKFIDETIDAQIGEIQLISEIPPNEKAIVAIDWQPSGSSQEVKVVVDPPLPSTGSSGSISEWNEANNWSNRKFSGNRFFLKKGTNSDEVFRSEDGLLELSLLSELEQNETILIEKDEKIRISSQPSLSYLTLPYRIEVARELNARLSFSENLRSEISGIYLFNEKLTKWIQLDELLSVEVKLPGIFALLTHSDFAPPTIELSVEHQGFSDDDYISEAPVITAKIHDENGIDLDKIVLIKNSSVISPANYSIVVATGNSNMVMLTYAPMGLEVGDYRIAVEAWDCNGNVGKDKIDFKIAGEFSIEKIANYPNPFVPSEEEGTDFAYSLTALADGVVLTIYTISGRLIFSSDKLNLDLQGDVGYNEFHWNGLDADGVPLANGVYFYKLTAKRSGEVSERVGKLVILK